jgi:hypothetical protein
MNADEMPKVWLVCRAVGMKYGRVSTFDVRDLVAAYPDRDVAFLHSQAAASAFHDWRIANAGLDMPARRDAMDAWAAYDPAADPQWTVVGYEVCELGLFLHPDEFMERHGR